MTHTNPQERDEQIAAMLRAGATYTQIKSELRVRNGTIRRVRADYGIPVPPGRAGARPLTAEERAAAVEQRHPKAATMLRAGFTHQETADACGISTGTVSDIRRALNIPVPPGRSGPKGPRQGRTAEDLALDDQVATLLTAGRSRNQICAELHVGSARITRVLAELRTTQAIEQTTGDTP